MSPDKPKPPTGKPSAPATPAAKTTSPAKSPPTPVKPAGPPAKVPPLFRRIDWLAFLLAFGAVWIGYYLTLAPEHTLEDSGELATGSFYAGIPHPPGYPVWTIYTWIWTVLLPIKNIAWRVALAEATAGALAAGLLGMLASRGSSLLMEGIEDLKGIVGRWENAICLVSGFVAGTLMGFNGFMWSQSVIVEVYSFSLTSLMIVFALLLRWIYAPHQYRFLAWALFFHGVCFTNHQTLIVAALGIEVAIAATSFKMGRSLFLGNSIIFIAGVILVQEHILTALESNVAVFAIFKIVGVASILAYAWFTILSKETFLEYCRDAALAGFVLFLVSAPANPIFWVLALACAVAFIKLAWDTRHLGLEWLVVILLGFCWLAGASFYFYMALAGMSDPPMMWGYPRTVEGFIHAFTRGQYEKANPANPFEDPFKFIGQLNLIWTGIKDEFNFVTAFLALVPFAFFLKMKKRERAWMIGMFAIYLCLGLLLLILLNPGTDKASQELFRVFFTASHTVIALFVGYGIAITTSYMATHYQRFRLWGFIGGGIAALLAIYGFVELTDTVYFGDGASVGLGELLKLVGAAFTNKDQYALPIFAGLLLIALAVGFVVSLSVYKTRAPLGIALVIFALMPLHSMMTHWSDNEQHEHWFGYWFGHDMFTPPYKWTDGKPLYPEMARNALLYGGTDPGRFCPTYMIFCDSFVPRSQQPKQDQNFDRRDVYLITQNALADGTYLNYIRAQYNRSTQKDPPFFQGFVDFIQTMVLPADQKEYKARGEPYTRNTAFKVVGAANVIAKPLDTFFTDLGDRIEKRRRTFTSWFTEKEFTDVAGLATKLRDQQDPVSKYLYQNLSPKTQQLLSSRSSDSSLGRALAADLNVLLERELKMRKRVTEKEAEKAEVDAQIADGEESSSLRQRQAALVKEIAALPKPEPLYDPERFKNVQISEYLADFIKQDPQSHTRIRLNRQLLEAAYPKEIIKSLGGVYPDREIYSATPDDSQKCFSEYLQDAQKRLQHDSQFPNEPKQIRPGEDVHIIDNRVQVSGQIAVMAINGLITKVMFDHNPKTEFYVEESFPLDWMYPHLTPFGIIMKINRQPLAELSEDILKTDHEFWRQFAKERLIGDVVRDDTPVKDIAAFIEKVYLHRDFKGFEGNRKFVRDDQGQKAFSKLRSSIGGIYAWRIANSKPNSPEQQRMIKEADFAFRQAFAFCPYSPEAVFRYCNLLFSLQRFDDAYIVALTCQKLDPNNTQVAGLVDNIQKIKKQMSEGSGAPNLQAAFDAAANFLRAKDTNRAIEIFDQVLNFPQADAQAVIFIAQRYNELQNYPKLESAIDKLTKMKPDQPDYWYDLAGIKAYLNKPQEALPALRTALELSDKRVAQDPKSRNLRVEAQSNPQFATLRQLPEFKQLTAPK